MALTTAARERQSLARWLVPVLVILLTLKVTHGVLGTFDVWFDDETIYLDAAHHTGQRYLPLADSSPLYPLWYRALSTVEPDLLRLYFLNWFVLTAALPVLLYALARRSGAPLGVAALTSIAWAISSSVMTWPYVSKFALLLLGLSALAATAIRDRRLAAAVTVVAMALAAYARAELAIPSFAFAGLVGLWSLWSCLRTLRWPKSRRRLRQRWQSFFALCLCAGAPLGLRRIFADPGQGGRAFFAFAQHYALNLVEDRHLPVDPWTTWDRYAREAFPHAQTIPEAFKENPAAFLWHVRRNLTSYPHAVEQLLSPMRHVPLVIAVPVVVLVIAIVCVGGVALALKRRPINPRLRAWLPLYFALAITTGGSTLLVYPREHYLLPLVWLTLALVAAACGPLHVPALLRPRFLARLPRLLRAPGALGHAALVGTLLLLLVALPTRRPGRWPSLLASAEPPPPTAFDGRRTIEAIRDLHLQGKIITLESDHSRALYANLDFIRYAQWDKRGDFWPFIDALGIGLIVLNDRLREDPRFKSDPAFLHFVDGTGERSDFEFIPVKDTRVVLAVRRRLLAAAAARH